MTTPILTYQDMYDAVNAGETISFKGSGANSSFEIHNLQYQVIPEMSVQSMTTGALSLTLVLLSRLLP